MYFSAKRDTFYITRYELLILATAYQKMKKERSTEKLLAESTEIFLYNAGNKLFTSNRQCYLHCISSLCASLYNNPVLYAITASNPDLKYQHKLL